MKQKTWLEIAVVVSALLLAWTALANNASERELKILVKADGAELIDADITDLATGESRTFVTDSGTTVDVVRTLQGVDLYIDGILQDLDFEFDGLHGEHRLMHEEFDVACADDTDGACRHEFVFISSDRDYAYAFGGEDDVTVIKKVVEIVCEDGEDCASLHDEEQAHKVIRVKRKRAGED